MLNDTKRNFLAAIATSYLVAVADYFRVGGFGPIGIIAIVFIVLSFLGFLIA